MEPVKLVAGVLDKQIVDSNKRHAGKVDGLVIVLRKGKPPRVGYIEIGTAVLARRFSKRLERWVIAIGRRFGVRQEPRYRVPWSKVKKVAIDVQLDFDASDTPALAWERWLRDHVVGKAPFAR